MHVEYDINGEWLVNARNFRCLKSLQCDSSHVHGSTGRLVMLSFVQLFPHDSDSLRGIGKIKFPLLSDFKKEASEAYDVLADDGSSHRGLFLIDKLLKQNTKHFSLRYQPLWGQKFWIGHGQTVTFWEMATARVVDTEVGYCATPVGQ